VNDGTDIKSIRNRIWLQFIIIVAGIILTGYIISFARVRIDLTEDRRYSLSDPTRTILDGIENDIYVQVFLDGEMPIPLKRLKRSVSEMQPEDSFSRNDREL